LKPTRYRYFDEVCWAEAFMDGSLMFRSLSHYLQIEDGEIRGDAHEGSVTLRPAGGLVINNQTQGKSYLVPEGAFGSRVNTEEIFILCASASATNKLRERFNAKALVEIHKVAALRGRIQAQLPPTATFRSQRVTYYSPAWELGAKWALPDMIAFSKVDSYEWQDEYRFCFSLTDALKFGQTKQQITIPNLPPGNAVPPTPPVPRSYPLQIRPLGDICTLIKF
jgi:hypothetical protein